MSKKNKLMLAAAVIAVLLLVGSGVARCSLAREDVEGTNSAIEAVEKEESSASHQGAPAEEHADMTTGLEALVVCWARAIQLYIMAAFSPIPLAFLGFDQTRQIGLGYLKSFGAVCIAGLIILILLISFPVILGGIVAVNPGTGTPIDAIANGLTYALQYLAMCVLLILSRVKSGAWARDIMGGCRPGSQPASPSA